MKKYTTGRPCFIKLFNTIEQKNNVIISDDVWGKIKRGDGKIINIQRTKKVQGSNINLFGSKVKHRKVKEGECIFPFKIRKKGTECVKHQQIRQS